MQGHWWKGHANRERAAAAGVVGVLLATGFASLLAASAPAAPPVLGLSAGNATIGGSIHATANLSESPGAAGEISFEVFGPNDPNCLGAAQTLASTAVNGEGEYPSADFTPAAPGSYSWTAHYSGDGVNEPTDAICAATSTVAKASPTLTGNAGSATVGAAIHDEAGLSGGFSPSGEVTFSLYGPGDTDCSTPLATGTAPLQSGTARSADHLAQQAGDFRWTASYSGDADNEGTSTPCGAAGQTSAVGKASPSLSGQATSVVTVGQPITDTVTVTGGFDVGGKLLFRAYGPDDPACTAAPTYEATVSVDGGGPYAPAGFSPGPGLYRWTVEYGGDPNNQAAGLACGIDGQASAVGVIAVTMRVSATSNTVGKPVNATATIEGGATPGGQITFRAFPPGDANCTGAPAFSSVVTVAGNHSYNSAIFVPDRVGSYRWTAVYSGDANHSGITASCGSSTSTIARAAPSILGWTKKAIAIGDSIQDTVALQGAHSPTGTITFRIYGPGQTGCPKPLLVNTVAIGGGGPFKSDPLVPQRPGRYIFLASYSGDAANVPSTEGCETALQAVVVRKRSPMIKPRARLTGNRQISIHARLSGAFKPAGRIEFRLYKPADRRCKRQPAFAGATSVTRNGQLSLAEYLATKPGVYRLVVGYSGDLRNNPYRATCRQAQQIRVGA